MSRQYTSPVLIAAIIVAVLGLSALLYFKLWHSVPEPAESELPTASAPPEAPPPETPPPPPEIVLPALDASDEIVRQLTAELSSHPDLVKWLATDDLARRFAVVVDNVARGQSPRGHLLFLEPEGRFEATEKNGAMVVSARSLRRYDVIMAAFTSLDNEGSARLYRDLLPLFEEAYGELGNPDTFEEAFRKAIDHLLAVPVPAADAEVVEGVTSWTWADEELDGLSGAQKQLLRMGPKNARSVQAKLLTLKAALALTRGDGG